MTEWEPDYDSCDETEEIMGAYINGRWADAEDLPCGYGNSPDWWEDDGFGETFKEYMEHTD